MNRLISIFDFFARLRKTFNNFHEKKLVLDDLQNQLIDYILDSNLPDRLFLATNIKAKKLPEKLLEAGSQEDIRDLLNHFGLFGGEASSEIENRLIERITHVLLKHVGTEGERLIFEQTKKHSEINLDAHKTTQRQIKELHDIEKNPIEHVANVIYKNYRAYGIKNIAVSPDSKITTIEFREPQHLYFEANDSQDKQEIIRFLDSIKKGEATTLEIDTDNGIKIKTDIQKLFPGSFQGKFTVTAEPLPIRREAVIRYKIGDYSTAVNTVMTFDRKSRNIDLYLKTSSDVMVITLNDLSNKINLSINLSLASNQRPSYSDLNILEIIARLNQFQQKLILVDETFGNELASIDLSACSKQNEVIEVTKIAEVICTFIKASNVLYEMDLIEEPLPWPSIEGWHNSQYIHELLKIVDVLIHKNETSRMTMSGEMEIKNTNLPNPVKLIKSKAIHDIIIDRNIFIFDNYSLKQTLLFKTPKVTIFNNGKKVKAESLEEAFKTYGSPLHVSLQSKSVISSYRKLSNSEIQ